MNATTRRRAAALAGLALLTALSGCAGGGSRGGARGAGEVNTGLNALGSNASADINSGLGVQLPDPRQPMDDREKAAWARQSALNLERLLAGDSAAVDGASTGATPPSSESTPPPIQVTQAPPPEPPELPELPEQTESSGLASLAGATPDADAAEPAPDAPQPAEVAREPDPQPAEATSARTPAASDPDAALADLASKMASLLRQQRAGADGLLTDSTALTPIEAMRPGTLATLDDPAGVLARRLSEEDLGLLRAARDRVLANPSRAQPDLVRALRGLGGSDSLAITRTALCLRVEGFGRFEPFASTTFLAGRPVRAIVYAELDNFEARPAREGDPTLRGVPITEQVTVDLTQSISLFHDRDGLLAWHRPPRAVVETGRSKRRDFYTIQIIDLPATLSVGRYNLVVTIADRTNGSEAQESIAIEVVADPTLVRARD